MLLADHAQVADGKLFVSGGGWNLASPGRLSCGVGLIFHVPRRDAARTIRFVVRLLTEAGEPVSHQGPLGEAPLEAAGEFEVGVPLHAAPGDDLNMPVAFNAHLNLTPGSYVWQVEIDGRADKDWTLHFRITEAIKRSTTEP